VYRRQLDRRATVYLPRRRWLARSGAVPSRRGSSKSARLVQAQNVPGASDCSVIRLALTLFSAEQKRSSGHVTAFSTSSSRQRLGFRSTRESQAAGHPLTSSRCESHCRESAFAIFVPAARSLPTSSRGKSKVSNLLEGGWQLELLPPSSRQNIWLLISTRPSSSHDRPQPSAISKHVVA
jgi:hypothetical protein